jgi:hypothetical protein
MDGKLVADGENAALAIAEGCTWVTRDADFKRFEPYGLRWQHRVLEQSSPGASVQRGSVPVR